MDNKQFENYLEEEQSPVHIKKELDINIPFSITCPRMVDSQSKETPKTAIREIYRKNDQEEVTQEISPKTQVDMSSPRLPFLTHSEILGIARNDEEDLQYSRSNINNPLESVEEISDEQTPSQAAIIGSHSQVPSQDFILDNISMANSQQLKFSKKSSSEKDSMIKSLEMENSRLKEEFKERIRTQENRIKELEQDLYKIRKKYNEERVKQLESQMEAQYKLTTIMESYQENEENLKNTINQLKNELIQARNQNNLFTKQQQSQQYQINEQKLQYDNPQKDLYSVKIINLLQLMDPKFDGNNKDFSELFSILNNRIRVLIQENEEEKMDEHRELVSTLKSEVSAIKQLRGQLSKIYIDYDQWQNNKKNPENDQKINELNLQILGMKQEKFEIVEENQKLQNQISQMDQIINELQKQANNKMLSSTDTFRKSSSFLRSLQGSTGIDLNLIKESLKNKQESVKQKAFKNSKVLSHFKSQNSPQSRSHNASPTLKFLNSPKNSSSNNSTQLENKSQFYKSMEFTSTHHLSHSTSSVQNDIIMKLVDQFKGSSSLAQKIQTYSKKQ